MHKFVKGDRVEAMVIWYGSRVRRRGTVAHDPRNMRRVCVAIDGRKGVVSVPVAWVQREGQVRTAMFEGCA